MMKNQTLSHKEQLAGLGVEPRGVTVAWSLPSRVRVVVLWKGHFTRLVWLWENRTRRSEWESQEKNKHGKLVSVSRRISY